MLISSTCHQNKFTFAFQVPLLQQFMRLKQMFAMQFYKDCKY